MLQFVVSNSFLWKGLGEKGLGGVGGGSFLGSCRREQAAPCRIFLPFQQKEYSFKALHEDFA